MRKVFAMLILQIAVACVLPYPHGWREIFHNLFFIYAVGYGYVELWDTMQRGPEIERRAV